MFDNPRRAIHNASERYIGSIYRSETPIETIELINRLWKSVKSSKRSKGAGAGGAGTSQGEDHARVRAEEESRRAARPFLAVLLRLPLPDDQAPRARRGRRD